MADVAERAGVSTMTVSRALKKGSPISDETRRRIMAAVDELGYVLDQTAGTLSSKRSGFVATLIPSINNSNFSDTVRGISEAIEGSGLQLLLGRTDYLVEKEETLLESMLTRRPEGILLTGGSHTPRSRRLLESAGIPIIETWDLPEKPIEHVVGFSNAAATRALVHDLFARGYRNIGFIGGTSNRDTRGADRRVGYSQAIAELGLGQSRIISFGSPPISMEQGGEAIVQLVTQWPEVDAAICVSDLSAFGALMECHRRGWAVPDRIAIAGFGDFEVSRCSHPRLTTVSVDAVEIGRTAGHLLLRAIEARREGRLAPPETSMMPFRVIQREST
ncbi:LacI family DNA-binding transcriptional regulator [Kaistia terrae]|jgi:LacI family gluconate utilization system Gnt-I transcriptional repressor|uniref:LacI family DNA-binding transcriptional regulator n=1 Tax=Kaistia terrae TaxID=537017 RepID=A0ABW0PQ01_9HYPH|nr:LacI family DNA-binding transcriptional regulator [Kaistia terrae]MCX5577939.1 LacI family DNA-binding transcriptional regulator [Kaistia terrae]